MNIMLQQQSESPTQLFPFTFLIKPYNLHSINKEMQTNASIDMQY